MRANGLAAFGSFVACGELDGTTAGACEGLADVVHAATTAPRTTAKAARELRMPRVTMPYAPRVLTIVAGWSLLLLSTFVLILFLLDVPRPDLWILLSIGGFVAAFWLFRRPGMRALALPIGWSIAAILVSLATGWASLGDSWFFAIVAAPGGLALLAAVLLLRRD